MNQGNATHLKNLEGRKMKKQIVEIKGSKIKIGKKWIKLKG